MQRSGQIEPQRRLVDTASEVGLGTAQPLQTVGDLADELVLDIRPAVGELGFREVPYTSFGIELGCEGGEPFEMESAMCAAQGADQLATVPASVGPQDDDGAAQMAQETIGGIFRPGYTTPLAPPVRIGFRARTTERVRNHGAPGSHD